MTSHRTLTAVLALLLGGMADVHAAGGSTPFEFLSLDANARPVALGGAYTALAADSNALLYNPGGLGFIERHEATFMHDEHFQGVHQEYASFAARQGWGLQLNYLSYGDLPKTTISNKAGDGLGGYGIQDLAVSGGYGRRLLPSLAVGGAVKYIRESIESVSARGMAADAGLLYVPEAVPGLRLGAAMRNFGPDVRFQVEEEKLPLEFRLGGAYGGHLLGQQTTLALDVLKSRGEAPSVSVGVESVLAEHLPVRLGYDRRNDAGPGLTAGFGWIQGPAQFDYAFVSYGDLGLAHRVSVTLRWGGREAVRAAAPLRAPKPAVAAAAPAPAPKEPSDDRRVLAADASPRAVAERPALPDLPPHLWLNYRLIEARTDLDARRLDEADAQLRAAEPLLSQGPDQRVLFLTLSGRSAYLRKDPARALDRYLEALRAADAAGASWAEVADAHAGAARCLLELGRPAEAESHIREGLAAHPSDETRRSLDESLEALGLAAQGMAWAGKL